jgi:hypothetical protein
MYNYTGDELVGGILCQKFVLDVHHGTLGTMDDHISFYWDPVLEKPVRWHMHSRHVTFGSHTDEYIMDILSFQPGAPTEEALHLPISCARPVPADLSIQLMDFVRAKPKGTDIPRQLRTPRSGIFEKNSQLLRQLNQDHAGIATFKANRFLDMTREEVMSFRGGKTKGTTRSSRRTKEHLQYVRQYETRVPVELPKNFDWRVERPGVVSPVKDQAMCGSCWTYGATEPIESIQAIQNGKLVELPEQFVVDCTWTNNTGVSGKNSGCNGGDSDIGVLEIVRKYGGIIPTAEAYGGYLSVNGFCKDIRSMDIGAKVTGWMDIKARDDRGLMEALVSKGPISVGIMVPDEMLYYDSGVLKVSTCKYDTSQIDHAVVLVGFGTDANGVDYWTIRNSWSTYWGDEGYIKIARGEMDCCVSCEAGYPELASAKAGIIV